ncbi:MAG: isoprenylcysteine carboxylmethyltransferase family protein [Candidatus Lokiarchaeota archaeon]|nr:isoprenylcysteine carboxylmethyltransferase family protein [Candidatus Lokiarchaeota archaeon]
MNNQSKQEGNENFPLLGVGPKILISLCPFLVLFGILNSIYHQFFQIPINYYWMVIIGSILIISGTIIFIYSERIIKTAYDASEVITTKIYGHVRHPMYASWGLGTLPGIFCLINSWLLFLILPIYYLIVRIYIVKEEKFLLSKFGNSYFVYKKDVNAFFPKLKKYKQ